MTESTPVICTNEDGFLSFEWINDTLLIHTSATLVHRQPDANDVDQLKQFFASNAAGPNTAE